MNSDKSNDSYLTLLDKTIQLINTWRGSMNRYYYVNLLSSEPPVDYVWKCLTIHQSILFSYNVIVLIIKHFSIDLKNSSINIDSIKEDYFDELKNIRLQIIHYFKVEMKSYFYPPTVTSSILSPRYHQPQSQLNTPKKRLPQIPLKKNLPPPPPRSLRKEIPAGTPETLAQTPPQSPDLLKEIKCFHESQRECHYELAQVAGLLLLDI